MRNFHKISPRPPLSVFIITQKLKIIFKSNQSHFHVYTKSQFKIEKGEKCECFPDLADKKSVAKLQHSGPDFCRTKAGKTAQNSVAEFGSSVADFGLHNSSKISLTMRFSLKNHS